MITRELLEEKINNANEEIIELKSLVFDPKKFSRVDGIDQRAVDDYSKNVISIPALIINQNNIIVDGVHRYHALLKAEQESAKVKRIELDDDDIKIAGLIIDLHSGVRHPEKDVKKICIERYSPNPDDNKALMETLEVPQRTFYLWTEDIRREMQKEVNREMAYALLDANKTQKEIADDFGVTTRTIINFKNQLCEIFATVAKISLDELKEKDLDFLEDYQNFKPFLYNIWNLKNSENDYFGHFPQIFMDNLLYYHTEPFDLVYDPFAGSGTTIDACRRMFRKCIASDRKPEAHRTEIMEWDIKNGLPDIPKPDLVFLDPPYWVLAKREYSDDGGDLGNMTKDEFFDAMRRFVEVINKREVERIAYLIRPIWETKESGWEWVDPMFDFYETLSSNYKIETRYVLPYSTQQYSALWVERAKKENKCLILNRELTVLIRR